MNLEQNEALQADLTNKNMEFYKTLSEGDQAKYDAIHQAMTILTDAGVGTTAFCWTKHFASPNEEAPVQYNNWAELAKLYEEGYDFISEEQTAILQKANTDFAMAMWAFIQQHVNNSVTGEDTSDPWKNLIEYFSHYLKLNESRESGSSE